MANKSFDNKSLMIKDINNVFEKSIKSSDNTVKSNNAWKTIETIVKFIYKESKISPPKTLGEQISDLKTRNIIPQIISLSMSHITHIRNLEQHKNLEVTDQLTTSTIGCVSLVYTWFCDEFLHSPMPKKFNNWSAIISLVKKEDIKTKSEEKVVNVYIAPIQINEGASKEVINSPEDLVANPINKPRRLSLIAKELGVSISTIHDFLKSKGHLIENSPMEKISVELYTIILNDLNRKK